jgi:hypothetical protein
MQFAHALGRAHEGPDGAAILHDQTLDEGA